MLRTSLAVTAVLSLALGTACKKDPPVNNAAQTSTTAAQTTPTDPAPPAAVDPAHDPEAIKAAAVQVEGLKKMCADSADDRAKRQKAKLLYTRLGGNAALTAVVTDIIELHATEEITKQLMVGVDKAKLVKMVVDFLAQGAGGPEKYTGRDMVAAHAHLKMTDVHFMVAGEQIMRTLAKYKVPEPETQEVICAIVAHHDAAIR